MGSQGHLVTGVTWGYGERTRGWDRNGTALRNPLIKSWLHLKPLKGNMAGGEREGRRGTRSRLCGPEIDANLLWA